MLRSSPLPLVVLVAACRPAPGATADLPRPGPLRSAAPDAEPEAPPTAEPIPELRAGELGYVRTRERNGESVTQLLFVSGWDETDRAERAVELLLDEDDAFARHPSETTALELGLPAVDEVWLFGPDGPCQAKRRRVFAGFYEDVVPTLELGWELDACAEDHAPVAHLGPNPPPLRWISADVRTAGPVERKAWADPMAGALAEQGMWDVRADEYTPKTAPRFHARIAEAGPVVELSWAQHWPGDACEELEHQDLTLYVREGERLTPIPTSEAFGAWAELEGTLVGPEGLVATIGTHAFQLWIGTGPLEQGRYQWTELLTGNYHEEDTAYWGWSVLEAYCGP